ncbi:MAG: DUF1667 domain-containing protein [Firmicutes bacterium]|jgi:CxxC motif-containing protein|nr:DUF1667 domain-containing protein [Bacillota bacterium]
MSTIYELTCIACPMGCQIKTKVQQDKIISIKGNSCKRGELYAQDEIFRPMRVITSTVRVQGGVLPVVPVRTAEPIPKDKIGVALQEIACITVTAPVKFHQVIVPNIADTGVSVVASRPLAAKEGGEKTA